MIYSSALLATYNIRSRYVFWDYDLPNIFWYSGIVGCLHRVPTAVFRREGPNSLVHLRSVRHYLRLIIAAQLALWIILCLQKAPFVLVYYPPELPDPCTNLSAAYFLRYCQMMPVPEVHYECADGGWYWYSSAYEGCHALAQRPLLLQNDLFEFAIGNVPPAVLLLEELRAGHRALTVWRVLGNFCFYVVALSMSVAMMGLLFLTDPVPWLIPTLLWVTSGAYWGAMIFYNFEEIVTVLRSAVRRPAEFDVFLSHDWGTDGLGRSNHQRVSLVNDHLKAAGLRTWFDGEQMNGDIDKAMSTGLDHSKMVLVFVTDNYLIKTAGDGPRGQSDNCRAEFNYALNRRGVERMLAVVMEPSCCDTKRWRGPVGLRCGMKLFVDASAENAAFENAMQLLITEIRRTLATSAPGAASSSGASSSQTSSMQLVDSSLTTLSVNTISGSI